ncbi:MAG: hypothetical protein KDA28_13230, partial [Phycisphaerales bacterium]|nr:hypothetical protein [Phycisphaerales bacterium]
FTSTRGVALFNDGGELVGLDAIDTTSPLIPGVIAQDAVVTIETSERRAPGGVTSFALHVVDTLSCKRLAGTNLDTRGRAPRRLALLDGRILVTAGNVTIVIEARSGED